MSPRSRAFVRFGAWGFLLLLLADPAPSVFAQPVRVWGEVGVDLRREDFERQGSLEESAAVTRVNASTYFYEPWLATFEGGIGYSVRDTEGRRADSTSERVTGDATLRVFPLSHFPLEVFAERTDSRTDTDLSGTDLTLTRYGFEQRYAAASGGAYRLRFERAETSSERTASFDDPERREDVNDNLQLGFNRNFGVHGLTFDSSLTRVESDLSEDFSRTAYSALRHTYRPGPALNAEDLLTHTRSEFARNESTVRQDTLQLNSFAHWRPPSRRKLRVSATFRALGRDNQFEDTDSSLTSATSTLGANYDFSERVNMNASAGATVVDTRERQDRSTFQAASVAYTSARGRFLGTDAGYFGQFDVQNTTDSQSGDVQSAGVQVGYDLRRRWASESGSTVSASAGQSAAGQSASFTSDSQGLSTSTLLTSASINWQQRSGSRASMVGFSVSDSRTRAYDGERADAIEGTFQIANLQASVNQGFDMHSSLSGNATLQATRSQRNTSIGGDDADDEWRGTATVDLTYSHRRALDVPRLSFRSTLRYVSDARFSGEQPASFGAERDDRVWENLLEYTIGRLLLRLTARVAEFDDERQSLVLLQARRLFGDL